MTGESTPFLKTQSGPAGVGSTDRARHPDEVSIEMTTAEFDACASAPRYRRRTVPYTHRMKKPCERTVVRVAWLIARFARREFVAIDRYHERFGVSLRTFRRDLAVLCDAGMYVEAHPTRGYKLPWFGPSIDAG
jgi:HTH domain